MKHISAGLVIIHQEKILLVRQAVDKNGRHLSIPKGLIKPGESPLKAAIRETFEETGVSVSPDDINTKPFLMNIETKTFQRRIIYYIARIERHLDIIPVDQDEIKWAGFLSYAEAERCLQLSQQSVLLHLNAHRLPARASEWLCLNGYLAKEEHHEIDLYIYNYTAKCKRDGLWDEITFWCRGLITDCNNNIKYRPIKKFFEKEQMYQYFVPKLTDNFRLFEKKDGALGILYWTGGFPYIATRGSFNSLQAINGTRILYTKYYGEIHKLKDTYTYFFEMVYPKDRHVVDYGDTEDLFLIGAYDNIGQRDILLEEITDINIPKVKQIPCHDSWEELLKVDKENEEGYVAYFNDGTRIKIKFPSYKKKHELLYG